MGICLSCRGYEGSTDLLTEYNRWLDVGEECDRCSEVRQ